MASDPGPARADLSAADPDPTATDLFELLRRLETAELRFGRAGGPGGEPARLGQDARLAFAAGDVAGIRRRAGAPPRIAVNVIGLLGPEGPMPLHLTRWVLARLSERWFAGDAAGAVADTAFLDFTDVLQHRMIALFWRAWADARPEVAAGLGLRGRRDALLDALAGLGLPGLGDDDAARRHATSLGHQVNGPERLCAYLAEALGVPVRLAEFRGAWQEIPAPLQTRIGRAHARLGRSAVPGRRVWDRAGQAALLLGPLDLATFCGFLDAPGRLARLRRALLHAAGQDICFDVTLILAAAEIPPARLGAARLGRTAWLAHRQDRDAADLRLRDVLGRRPGTGGRAAA